MYYHSLPSYSHLDSSTFPDMLVVNHYLSVFTINFFHPHPQILNCICESVATYHLPVSTLNLNNLHKKTLLPHISLITHHVCLLLHSFFYFFYILAANISVYNKKVLVIICNIAQFLSHFIQSVSNLYLVPVFTYLFHTMFTFFVLNPIF